MLLETIDCLILEVKISKSREISRKAVSRRFKSLVANPTLNNVKRLGTGVSTILKVEGKHLKDKYNIVKQDINKDMQNALDQTAKGVVKDAANITTGIGKKISSGFTAGIDKYKEDSESGKSKLDSIGSGVFRGIRSSISGVPDKKTAVSGARLAAIASGWKGASTVLGASALYHTIKNAKENGTFNNLDNRVDSENLKKYKTFRKNRENEKKPDLKEQLSTAVKNVIKKVSDNKSPKEKVQDKVRDDTLKANTLAIDTYHSKMQNAKTAQERQKHYNDLVSSINTNHLSPDHKDFLRQTGILEYDSTYI